eukprot:TRINITY_DN12830_c0_g2_i1.p1 TRINITY_DN12830_c0_g2~~TRINITY_DN12830_c0_g2_i1.p1  ORF type:complete len:549 (-),score=118.00 TRINITY_DN12830_c0_g2_i1:154-1800(-)
MSSAASDTGDPSKETKYRSAAEAWLACDTVEEGGSKYKGGEQRQAVEDDSPAMQDESQLLGRLLLQEVSPAVYRDDDHDDDDFLAVAAAEEALRQRRKQMAQVPDRALEERLRQEAELKAAFRKMTPNNYTWGGTSGPGPGQMQQWGNGGGWQERLGLGGSASSPWQPSPNEQKWWTSPAGVQGSAQTPAAPPPPPANSGGGKSGSDRRWQNAPPGGYTDLPLADPAIYQISASTQRQYYKRRFCCLVDSEKGCQRGAQCRFAHSRSELDTTQLLTEEEEMLAPEALTEDFFIRKFKVFWCPIGVQHDWHSCPYAHNYQDARRVVSIGYGPELCPYWKKSDSTADYTDRCPNGVRCVYAHGAKEHLYHPAVFRTLFCRDLKKEQVGAWPKGNACPRRTFCAFFHDRRSQRQPEVVHYDYMKLLPEDCIDAEWLDIFLSPAFPPGDGTYSVDAASLPSVYNGWKRTIGDGSPQRSQDPDLRKFSGNTETTATSGSDGANSERGGGHYGRDKLQRERAQDGRKGGGRKNREWWSGGWTKEEWNTWGGGYH